MQSKFQPVKYLVLLLLGLHGFMYRNGFAHRPRPSATGARSVYSTYYTVFKIYNADFPTKNHKNVLQFHIVHSVLSRENYAVPCGIDYAISGELPGYYKRR